MKSLKDIIGPVRSNKRERVEQSNRMKQMNNYKMMAMKKFGPDIGLLAYFRQGKV